MSHVSMIDGHIDEPKMTDEQIIKDLKTCFDVGACESCGHNETRGGTVLCRTHLMGNALDLINRLNEKDKKNERIIELNNKLIKTQSAEIERLQEAGKEAVSCFTRMESLYKIKCKELEVAKSEAIKEFAERLTDKADLIKINAFDSKWSISQDDIDNLVKEMVGDDNGNK